MNWTQQLSLWYRQRQRQRQKVQDLAMIRAMPPLWMHSALLTYQIKMLLGAYDA